MRCVVCRRYCYRCTNNKWRTTVRQFDANYVKKYAKNTCTLNIKLYIIKQLWFQVSLWSTLMMMFEDLNSIVFESNF